MKSLTLVSSSFGLWLLFASSLCTFCFCIKNTNNILCIADERSALFEFKRNLIDYNNRLSSWSGEDCCNWCGVVCDKVTGHVHEIRLRGPDDGICSHSHESNEIHDKLGEAFNPMLGGIQSPSLINLKQLRYLDLSYHNFISREIPAFIGFFLDLKRLQDLDKHGIKLERAASNCQQNNQMSQSQKRKTNNAAKCPSLTPPQPFAKRTKTTLRISTNGGPHDQRRPGPNNKSPGVYIQRANSI